jgi:pyruvate,water dikinase
MHFIRWFSDVAMGDVSVVGGKNASLGEMIRELTRSGIRVPDGYAVTADGYRHFIRSNDFEDRIAEVLAGADHDDSSDLTGRTRKIRNLIDSGDYPEDLRDDIHASYGELAERVGFEDPYVAVRSSATAEDLPTASFAGQQESYLMIHGASQVLDAVKLAYASLFTTRAVNYRKEMGFAHLDIALSVGIQQMVRADTGTSGVIFTLDTETGFRDVVLVTAGLGLGENSVKGKIDPDA